MPEISPRARHSCARHRFGGQGTAGPTWPRGVVEAVVSTACVSVLAATSTATRIGERGRGRVRSPGRSTSRRYAIGERVRVKIGVITQTVPRTVFLVRLRDAVFFTRGKVVPRIVASDGEERPVGALQMLH